MHGLLILLLQIAVVLLSARALGWLFRRLHQPQVVGEMVAGILLGPSLLGLAAPAAYAFLFPADSLPALQTLSQVGLLFFMFLVGLELDLNLMRGKLHAAVVISHTSILAPFALGTALAFYLADYAPGGVSFLGYALFMGAAMSVTAFPVLARILAERNLLKTRVGAMAVACAAVDDVTAWCLLAGVVALVRADGGAQLLFTLGGSVAYVAAMLFLARPLLGRLEALYETKGRLTQAAFGLTLLFAVGSAWTTEWLGIHALFGAFLAGAVMPRHRGFVREVSGKLEDLTVVFLLPLFFAATGLRTRIGLVEGWGAWLDCALIILVAVAGKFGGSALAARSVGFGWRPAGAIGVLMNTRGLMELVILTIGLELGVIPPVLFAMMVLMALVTTFMTTPLLQLLYPPQVIRQEAGEAAAEFRVLLPVSNPASGPDLLRAARALAPVGETAYYALNLVRALDQPLLRARSDTPDLAPLEPLLEAARTFQVEVHPAAFVSPDPAADIASFAGGKDVDLIVMGWSKPLLNRSVLGGTISDVMRRAGADIAVYIARSSAPWRRVLAPYAGGPHDEAALRFARQLARREGARLTILQVLSPHQREAVPGVEPTSGGDSFDARPEETRVVVAADPVGAAVEEARLGYDLVVVGASETWGMEPTSFGPEIERLALETPGSLLIVHRGTRATHARPSTPAETDRRVSA